MILTDKCKEDFLTHNNITEQNLLFGYSEREINSLIIEFFDSVGIIILLKRFAHKLEFSDWYFIITNKQGVHLNNYLENRVNVDSRQEATKQAIIKANEIYNEKKA